VGRRPRGPRRQRCLHRWGSALFSRLRSSGCGSVCLGRSQRIVMRSRMLPRSPKRSLSLAGGADHTWPRNAGDHHQRIATRLNDQRCARIALRSNVFTVSRTSRFTMCPESGASIRCARGMRRSSRSAIVRKHGTSRLRTQRHSRRVGSMDLTSRRQVGDLHVVPGSACRRKKLYLGHRRTRSAPT